MPWCFNSSSSREAHKLWRQLKQKLLRLGTEKSYNNTFLIFSLCLDKPILAGSYNPSKPISRVDCCGIETTPVVTILKLNSSCKHCLINLYPAVNLAGYNIPARSEPRIHITCCSYLCLQITELYNKCLM